MGLYLLVEQLLPNTFSIFQFMSVLEMDKDDAREARNILKQFYLKCFVKRVSKNMYIKVKTSVKV